MGVYVEYLIDSVEQVGTSESFSVKEGSDSYVLHGIAILHQYRVSNLASSVKGSRPIRHLKSGEETAPAVVNLSS